MTTDTIHRLRGALADRYRIERELGAGGARMRRGTSASFALSESALVVAHLFEFGP